MHAKKWTDIAVLTGCLLRGVGVPENDVDTSRHFLQDVGVSESNDKLHLITLITLLAATGT